MIYTNTKAVFVSIRQVMIAKDLKIKDIADRLCKSQSAVSSLFAQSNISLDSLDEICQAIDCQLEINIVPKDNETNTNGMSDITPLKMTRNLNKLND